MPWKQDEKGNLVAQDGKPVWVYGDGKEAPLDGGELITKIDGLNSEAASRRRELREAQDKLKAFEGIDNPAEFLTAARKALDTVKNLDDKKLIDAGEAERVKEEVKKAMQAQLDDVTKQLSEKDASLVREMIGGRFSRSKFIADKLVLPSDVAEAYFGKRFAIKDGKVVATDAAGNPIYSREKPGEPADFDEALSILVDAYPSKANILKGSGASGSGAPSNGNGGGGGKKSIGRAQFDALSPAARAEHMKSGGTVTD